MKILCVEDDQIDQRLLREMIGSLNWSAIYASNGLDGYAHAQTQRFDVIVANQDMADLTGLGLFKCLRKGNGPNAETPFLLSSWDFTPDVMSSAKDLRVDALTAKPFVKSHFRDQVIHLSRQIEAANEPAEPSSERRRCSIKRSVALIQHKLFG